MGQDLRFELLPCAAGYDSHLHDTKQALEKLGHLLIQRRLAFRQRAIQIEDHKLLHEAAEGSGGAISSMCRTPCGSHEHSPTAAGKSSTSPFPTG